MESWIEGIHHVTGAAVDPQQDYDFYTKVLGLRLVKRTVNHENPVMWHFFYGDYEGHAGTVMTNFLFKGLRVPPCKRGRGTISAVAYSVPGGALPYWKERLERAGVACRLEGRRFGAEVLAFADPAGLSSELVESDDDRRDPPALAGIPDHAKVRGFHSVTLVSRIPELTERFFRKLLRFDVAAREDGPSGRRIRLDVDGRGAGAWVDLVEPSPSDPWGEFGIGALHHVAFTVATKERMERLWQTLSGDGLILTDLRDRKWFHSMYMTEPGGINVEFSNVDPGFAVDEPTERLGATLQLPKQWEAQREKIESGLPPLQF
jgi:glyoxalase family protein